MMASCMQDVSMSGYNWCDECTVWSGCLWSFAELPLRGQRRNIRQDACHVGETDVCTRITAVESFALAAQLAPGENHECFEASRHVRSFKRVQLPVNSFRSGACIEWGLPRNLPWVGMSKPVGGQAIKCWALAQRVISPLTSHHDTQQPGDFQRYHEHSLLCRALG